MNKPLFLLFFLFGCGSTEYQPNGFKGGYEDAHIKDNLYFVEFKANAYTDHLTTERFFLRRAKEVCLENGYSDFQIKGEKDISSSQGVVAGGIVAFVPKPGSAGYVECLKSKSENKRRWKKQ
ncbi:MAG: hypothetical protein AABY86_07345 [Bdellovibrionota bacterium]